MTKEEAIEWLKSLNYCDGEETQEVAQAIDMAIKALEQNTVSQETYDSEYLARKRAEQKLYEIEQNTCEDCVDRNHVIATISQHHFDKDKDNFDLLIHNLCKEINELPPVTPTRKQGEWDTGYGFPDGAYWKCSCCNELIKVRYPMNYCPNCGAEMRGSKNE